MEISKQRYICYVIYSAKTHGAQHPTIVIPERNGSERTKRISRGVYDTKYRIGSYTGPARIVEMSRVVFHKPLHERLFSKRCQPTATPIIGAIALTKEKRVFPISSCFRAGFRGEFSILLVSGPKCLQRTKKEINRVRIFNCPGFSIITRRPSKRAPRVLGKKFV